MNDEKEKQTLYEKICMFFEKIGINPPKDLRERYEKEINFCHLKTTPKGVFSTAIFVPIIISISMSVIALFLNVFSFALLGMIVVLNFIVFYFLLFYTKFLVKFFRSKAASEMALAIVYMTTSLKVSRNLENAVLFAASNLKGPLGKDFKQILWELETGKLNSVIQGIDKLIEKWKEESEEFVDALTILKNTTAVPPSEVDKNLRKAVSIMLYGTKERMKKYSLALKMPLMIINMFGILLPVMGLIFFPIVSLFTPEIARPELLAFLYVVFLPTVNIIFMRQYFYHRPYSFHQIESKVIVDLKKLLLPIFFILVSCLAVVVFSSMQLLNEKGAFSFNQLIFSVSIVSTIGLSISSILLLVGYINKEKNEKLLEMERELPSVLFALSLEAETGRPFEIILEDSLSKIRDYKFSEIVIRILERIKKLGLNLKSALFSEKYGVMFDYPSKIIHAVMKTVVDISERGIHFLSSSLRTISEYLKDAIEVDDFSHETLSESTSQMRFQAWLLAPLTAGIVVGLMAIVLHIFTVFGGSLEQINEFLGGGDKSFGTISFLFNIGNLISFSQFQFIVGIYMIEIMLILSYFTGDIKYGDNNVSKILEMGETLLIGIFIYFSTILLLYILINGMITISAVETI